MSHEHSPVVANRRRLWLVLGLTVTFLAAEVAAGLWTGSLALLADAGHMLTDVGGLSLALFAMSLRDRPHTRAQLWLLARGDPGGAGECSGAHWRVRIHPLRSLRAVPQSTRHRQRPDDRRRRRDRACAEPTRGVAARARSPSLAMLGFAWRKRRGRELTGQLIRVLFAAPASWLGRAPLGTTGGSDVGLFAQLPVPDELRPYFDEDRP